MNERGCVRSVAGLVVMGAGLGGCALGAHVVHARETARVRGEGLEVQYRADIDRFTFIGPEDGPNLVFTQKTDQAPAKDEAYTFYGGGYTWIAPQNGPLGWRDAEGKERAWPPDPAMDIGPGKVERVDAMSMRIESPVGRTGLREVKAFGITGERTGTLAYALENTTNAMVTAGPWVNTAVAPGSVVAVRATASTEMWGWNDESIARLRTVMREVPGTGWSIVEPDKGTWDGGIKVYMEAPAEIAIWRDGWWLHRRQLSVDDGRLRAAGEGPVALYIQPAKGADVAIVEAELYGRLADIPPYGRNLGEERWTVIQSATADVTVLPRR